MRSIIQITIFINIINNSNLKNLKSFCGKKLEEFENLSVEEKTLSTALGIEPRSFDCRLKDLGLNPSAVESVFFSTERF